MPKRKSHAPVPVLFPCDGRAVSRGELSMDWPGVDVPASTILAAHGSMEDSAPIQWAPTNVLGESLPPAFFAFAVWDEPDETAQRTHFGKIALEGKALFDYCAWYRGLTERERREWDALVDRLQPGPNLINDLEAFLFSDEPAGGDKQKRLANAMIEAIVGELKRGS